MAPTKFLTKETFNDEMEELQALLLIIVDAHNRYSYPRAISYINKLQTKIKNLKNTLLKVGRILPYKSSNSNSR